MTNSVSYFLLYICSHTHFIWHLKCTIIFTIGSHFSWQIWGFFYDTICDQWIMEKKDSIYPTISFFNSNTQQMSAPGPNDIFLPINLALVFSKWCCCSGRPQRTKVMIVFCSLNNGSLQIILLGCGFYLAKPFFFYERFNPFPFNNLRFEYLWFLEVSSTIIYLIFTSNRPPLWRYSISTPFVESLP